jgi:hypothetical protein
MLNKKSEKWERKNLIKDNKKKESKIKIVTHKLLVFTFSYLILDP